MSFLLKSSKRLHKAEKVRIAVSVVLLLFFAVIMLFPIYFMFVTSLGRPVVSGSANYSLIPRVIMLDSYKFFFNYSDYALRWIMNSLVVSAIVMLGNALFASMAGYAFSRIQFKGRELLFWLFLGTMMVPYQVVQVPMYVLTVRVFHMQDTFAALILPGLCTAYNIFLMTQFTTSIPKEVLE